MAASDLVGILVQAEVISSESDFTSDESDIDIDLLVLSELCKFGHLNKRNCIKNYVEEIIKNYTEDEFRRHFRISRSLFEEICKNFKSSEIFKNLRVDKRLTPQKHVAVFLWFAGHEACSLRDLADRFDISLLSACRVISRDTMFLSALSLQLIKWPTEQEKMKSANFFKNKATVPKAIGCIDGTHVVIDPPHKAKDDYIDRKGLTSICLQGICNEEKKFITFFVEFNARQLGFSELTNIWKIINHFIRNTSTNFQFFFNLDY